MSILLLALQLFTTSHFDIYYPSQKDYNDIVIISDFLESEYLKLDNLFNFPSKGKIKVTFYNSVYDFSRKTNSDKSIGGVALGNEIFLQPIGILKERNITNSVLKHELVHVFFYRNPKIPKWLNEAYALYYANDLSRYHVKKIPQYSSILDLEKMFRKNYSLTPSDYFLLGLTMQFLTNTYSNERIVNIIKIVDKENQKDVFEKILDSPMTSINKNRKEYIAKHFRSE